MAKVTSKLQVTIPRAVAARHGIQPGDDIQWDDAGDVIQIRPVCAPVVDRSDRLEWFDRATQRQVEREADVGPLPAAVDRGWHREDLYHRGRTG